MATYARDKRKGGYLIRVAGPNAGSFAGREVPVETKAGTEHVEKLVALVWAGADEEHGTNAALYQFEPKPREAAPEDELPF